jgi:hypothetical protein
MSGFLEIALRNAARGYRVHPTNGKVPIIPGWPDLATTDPATIEQWAEQHPDANCGVAVGPDLCVLESDDLAKLKELLNGVEIPATYTVQARDNRPPFYFRQTAKTTLSGNRTLAGIFEFKQNRLQVIGEGSTHPSGAAYQIVHDSPIVDLPDELMTALVRLDMEAKAAQGKDAAPVEGSRNNYLTSVAGKLRNAGLGADALKLALLQHNADVCTPPLTDEEVEHIAASVARYDVPEPVGEVIVGGEKIAPDWRTHYHTVHEHDRVEPPSFLIEGFLPVQAIMGIGAFVGQKKTLAALNIAFSLCSGERLFGKYEVSQKPARVLYLGPENGLISFSDRVNRIGLRDYLGQTFFYATMSMPEHTPLGALQPEEIAGAAIIIDTAIRFTDGNENDATHMKEFAKQAFSLIRDKAACVIMLHHSPKGMTKTAEMTLENSFRGTGELSAFLSVALAMRTQDMDHEYESASLLRFVKQRDFEPRPSSFEVQTNRETCRMMFVDGSGGAMVKLGNTANKDGKDEAATALMETKANRQLSNVKMSKLLLASGIDRSKEWVRLKRGELGIGGMKVGSTL